MAAVARVRLADLSCAEGVAAAEYLSAAAALAGSLTTFGAAIVVLDIATVSAVEDVHVSAGSFLKQTAAAKKKHAAKSDAYGATGYRQLSGKQVYDFTLGDTVTPVPDVLACTAPRAYARLSAVGRAVLCSLTWSRQAASTGEPPADLAVLCEPVPLPPQRRGASLLSLFSYKAKSGAAEHKDRGLLTIVSSTDAGLELRGPSGDWLALQLQRGEVAVLVGATLAAASGQQLRAAVHRVVAQPAPRSSVVLRQRGAPEALLPRMSVAAFEKAFQESHPASVNRDGDGLGTPHSGANDQAVKDSPAGEGPAGGGQPASKRRRGQPTPKQLPPQPAPLPPPPPDDDAHISLKFLIYESKVRFLLVFFDVES